MKLVIAIIQPTKLSAVREALEKMEVARMTICDGQGFSRHTERKEDYRGHAYRAKLLRRVILEVIVNEDFLERLFDEFPRQTVKPHEILELKHHGYRIFSLLTLEVWCMEFLDRSPGGPGEEDPPLEEYLA